MNKHRYEHLMRVKYPFSQYFQFMASFYQGYFGKPLCLYPSVESLQWEWHDKGRKLAAGKER